MCVLPHNGSKFRCERLKQMYVHVCFSAHVLCFAFRTSIFLLMCHYCSIMSVEIVISLLLSMTFMLIFSLYCVVENDYDMCVTTLCVHILAKTLKTNVCFCLFSYVIVMFCSRNINISAFASVPFQHIQLRNEQVCVLSIRLCLLFQRIHQPHYQM
jgi:hypothetical protein